MYGEYVQQYCYILNMKACRWFETSVIAHPTTQHNIQEVSPAQNFIGW